MLILKTDTKHLSLSLRQSSLVFIYRHLRTQTNSFQRTLTLTCTQRETHARAQYTLCSHSVCSIRHSFISFRFCMFLFQPFDNMCRQSTDWTNRIKRENQHGQWKQQTRSVYDLTLHDQHVHVTSFGSLVKKKKKHFHLFLLFLFLYDRIVLLFFFTFLHVVAIFVLFVVNIDFDLIWLLLFKIVCQMRTVLRTCNRKSAFKSFDFLFCFWVIPLWDFKTFRKREKKRVKKQITSSYIFSILRNAATWLRNTANNNH